MADVGIMKPALQQWLTLKANRIHHQTLLLYLSWLIYGDDAKLIKSPFSQWLYHHGFNAASHPLLGFYADSDGLHCAAPITSQGFVNLALWLDANGTKKVTQYFYPTWLKLDGDLAMIEPYLIGWLNHNRNRGRSPFARNLIHSWIRAGGNPGLGLLLIPPL